MKIQKDTIPAIVWLSLFLLGIVSQFLLGLFNLVWTPQVGNIWYLFLVISGILILLWAIFITSRSRGIMAKLVALIGASLLVISLLVLSLIGLLFLSPSVAIDYKVQNQEVIVEPILAPANWSDHYKYYNDFIMSNEYECVFDD